MRRRRLVTLTAIVSAAMLPAAADAGEYRRCGPATYKVNGIVWSRTDALWQRGTSCKTARRVFRSYARHSEGADRPATFAGYRCSGGADGVACRRGRARVTWGWYGD